MKVPDSPAAVSSFVKVCLLLQATAFFCLRKWEGITNRSKSEDLQNEIMLVLSRKELQELCFYYVNIKEADVRMIISHIALFIVDR